MKYLIVIIFNLLFCISTFANANEYCTDEVCVTKQVQKLGSLNSIFHDECTQNIKSDQDLESFFLDNGISEKCWALINEIKYEEDKLNKIAIEIESSVDQNEVISCQIPEDANALDEHISDINSINDQVSCDEERKAQVQRTCSEDLNCFMFASAMGIGGVLAEKLIPDSLKNPSCNLANDSCATQLVTGFIKAVTSFFSGAWDLLKMAKDGIKNQWNQFWDWVEDAEDHSSTSQLAMVEASEDDGVFSMLVNDFSGTMSKMLQGLVGSIKEWLKTDIFCEKWEGIPRFSKCVTPYSDFDCTSCKTFATGLCAATGVIVAEIVPAFLTGGIVTAAKYGIQGASKIAKGFKISSNVEHILKKTKVLNKISKEATKIDKRILLTSNISRGVKKISTVMGIISKYFISPISQKTKKVFASLKSLGAKSKMFIAQTPTGKILGFSMKTLKKIGKVVIYPIENPMTVFAFKKGMTSFDQAFQYGIKTFSGASKVVTKVESVSSSAYKSLIQAEQSKLLNKSGQSENLALRKKYMTEIKPYRKKVIQKVFQDETQDFDEIIEVLYPELKFGKLSDDIPEEQLIKAEKEIWSEIKKIRDGPYKDNLIKEFHFKIVSSQARARLVHKTPLYTDIIRNTQLSRSDRLKEALRIIGKKQASSKLEQALEQAHLVGDNAGVYNYTWRDLREKYRILTDAGLTLDEADLLIRHGLAGRPPTRQLLKESQSKFMGHNEDILEKKYLEKRSKFLDLKKENPEQLSLVQKSKNWLKTRINKMYSVEETDILNKIESIYFVDNRHSYKDLQSLMEGESSLRTTNISEIYGKKEFKNYLDAKKYLLEEQPELSIITLKNVQAKMMKGGVEGLAPESIGHFRKGGVHGSVPFNSAISKKIKDEIIKNPYLTWQESGLVGDKFYGAIIYPNSSSIRSEGLNIIKARNPELVLEINEFQAFKRFNSKYKLDETSQKVNELNLPDFIKSKYKTKEELSLALRKSLDSERVLNEKLVTEMVEERFGWFKKARSELGDIDSPAKLDDYVDLVSNLQRDLVSIHPFSNGNGRTTREFILNYLLMKEGFPPPRIVNPNADIYKSAQEWADEVRDGMIASDHLMDDLLERNRMGLKLENSSQLVIPNKNIATSLKLQTGNKSIDIEGIEYIDPKLYREIVKRKIANNSNFESRIINDPDGVWEEINRATTETFEKNNIYYDHAKHGIERVEIGYVDDDFIDMFGRSTYSDVEKFKFKMNQWYQEDVVWRGLASKTSYKSEEDILTMFKELNQHMASNAVLKSAKNSSPKAIREAALKDFTKYNDDVFGDGLVKMAKDHSETGPLYGMSYGYSTSKNREVGKAFSMGAMVIAEYGSHKAPELQALLKSRILVGARRAYKDVDLTRLKQVRPEFSYKYGRQQEVMGIGASDPDAISIIQRIEADGSVSETYLRNPDKPAEIWHVRGDIRTGEVPTSENLIKTIDLTK